jgi:hypothetical protein
MQWMQHGKHDRAEVGGYKRRSMLEAVVQEDLGRSRRRANE